MSSKFEDIGVEEEFEGSGDAAEARKGRRETAVKWENFIFLCDWIFGKFAVKLEK